MVDGMAARVREGKMECGNEGLRVSEELLSCGMKDRLPDTYKRLEYFRAYGKRPPSLPSPRNSAR